MNLFISIKKLFVRKKGKDDFSNIVKSMALCKSLYKELIKESHPDKHPNKVELATEITELININRYNYAELEKIKNRIKNELR